MVLLPYPLVSENMTQMQQWHPDLVKPTAARERARPSLTRFCLQRDVPLVPNGETPPTRQRWAPSVLVPPRVTLSWRYIRSPARVAMAWRIHLGLTVMKNPSQCHLGLAASHHLQSPRQQSLPRQNGRVFLWTQEASPASREVPTVWPLLKGSHGWPVTGAKLRW